MPNLPIRDLGAIGVVTDVDPFNLPFNAFTRAKNVRFTNNNVERAPIFREVYDLGPDVPSFVFGLFSQSGYDTTLVATDTFKVYEYANNAVIEVYNGALTANTSPYTACTLANVEYMNRNDSDPIYRGPTMSTFLPLPNWPLNTSCDALRAYGDFLIALNTTEDGVEYPTRVRFSDLVLANNVPSTWDETDLTNSAGFNDLVQMETPILDGLTLGTNFYIYSSDQVWQMEFVGGQYIFNFRKVFDNTGVINQNCVVEVDNKHFVFDNDDIYIHDGISKQSICDRRVRNYIFSGLDRSKAKICYVQHNPVLEEVYFCYHSGDDLAVYTDGDHCNRAAVYNYSSDTWTFMDMPNTVAGTIANVNSVETYDSINLIYDTVGGTYHEQESKFTRYCITVSRSYTGRENSISTNRLLGIDLVDKGFLTKGIVQEIITDAVLERTGIDLDEAQIPLSGYKLINRIYPQVTTVNPDPEILFQFGASQFATQNPEYDETQVFDIANDYKVDTRMSGRYLSYRVTTPTPKDFTLSGFDLDIQLIGRR